MNPSAANSPSAVPPLARTPLYHWHERNGARLGEWEGWQVAEVYTEVDKEVTAAKRTVAIADISAFAKISLLGVSPGGTGGGTGVSPVFTFDQPDTGPTQPHGVAASTADPSILVCRLKEDQLLLMALTTNRAGLEKLLATASPGVIQHDVTSAYAGLWLIGPEADAVLRRLTHHNIAAMAAGSCAETGLVGVPAFLIRPPKLSIPSMQVLFAWDVAEFVWEAVVETGRKWDIALLGMEGLEEIMQS
jgi:glycine cleavage system aminomethyltransferase T